MIDFFYSSYHLKFVEYLKLDEYNHKFSFLTLLDTSYISQILKITENNKKIYLHFFNDYFLNTHYWYELVNAYVLFMQTAVTKYEDVFKLGLLSFKRFDLMIKLVFMLNLDKKRLLQHMQKKYFLSIFFHYF